MNIVQMTMNFLKISIGAVIKNLKMLIFLSNCLKTKKMCKAAVKKLLFTIRYVPFWCKTQKKKKEKEKNV